VLSTSEYEVGDAMCCPSGEGELRYRIEKGQLKRVPNPPEEHEETIPVSGAKNTKARRAAF